MKIYTISLIFSIFLLSNTDFPVGAGVGFTDRKVGVTLHKFFKGDLKNLEPADRVFPYEVNAPLFSDYAEKLRFIYLPEGEKMQLKTARDSLYFDLPIGTVLIKNFYYSYDQRKPELGRKILETRLLIYEKEGWKPQTFHWNDAQTDAQLEVAGGTFPIKWTDERGKKQSLEYLAPNLNQCKSCHSYDGQFVLLGVVPRQLNQPEAAENQLIKWQKGGLLELPEGFDLAAAAQLPNTNSTEKNTIETRARAYLDSNCGHCHNAHGPASTSGLYLNFDEKHPEMLGVNKPPVAAGRASGKLKYSIVPGKPDQSILVFRMENDDPGIRMPETGRQMMHREGVELIRRWIQEMK